MKKVYEKLDNMIDRNKELIESQLLESININFNFKTNEVEKVEKVVIDYLNKKKIDVVTIDLLNENERIINLVELFDALNNKNSILYLKNYSEVESQKRYRFSEIFKDSCAANNHGILERENLSYLGTLLITNKESKFKMDFSEKCCFRHIEL